MAAVFPKKENGARSPRSQKRSSNPLTVQGSQAGTEFTVNQRAG